MIFTIVSSSFSGVILSISDVRRIIPLRLASKIVSISDEVEFFAFVKRPIPALLKRYSTVNEFFIRYSPTFRISSSLPILQTIDSVKKLFEAFLSLEDATESFSLLRPRMRTFFPDLTSSPAISNPRPLVPPLITDIFFILIFFKCIYFILNWERSFPRITMI